LGRVILLGRFRPVGNGRRARDEKPSRLRLLGELSVVQKSRIVCGELGYRSGDASWYCVAVVERRHFLDMSESVNKRCVLFCIVGDEVVTPPRLLR